MKNVLIPGDFAAWRILARELLSEGIPPEEVFWSDQRQLSIIGYINSQVKTGSQKHALKTKLYCVPRQFLRIAAVAACHSSTVKWEILYQALWRILQGERDLLQDRADSLSCQLWQLEYEVKRDAHRMKGFLRFKKVEQSGEEFWVACYAPDHLVLKLVSPFFVRRFNSMNWSILTPDACAHWYKEQLVFGPGLDLQGNTITAKDSVVDLWRTFYNALNCPERNNPRARASRMPKKIWDWLPEINLLHK